MDTDHEKRTLCDMEDVLYIPKTKGEAQRIQFAFKNEAPNIYNMEMFKR